MDDNDDYQRGYDRGWSDAMAWIVSQTEDEAIECRHGNMVWFGHECGECE